MNAINTKDSARRKLPNLKRLTDSDEQPSNKRRRITDVVQTSLAPKNRKKKSGSAAKGTTSKKKLPKPRSSRAEKSGSIKKERKAGAKKCLTDPDGQPSNKRRRTTTVVKKPGAPKKGKKKSGPAAKGTTPKRKLRKPLGSRAKNSGSIKKKRTARAKKPFWMKSVCSVQTLSLPIITRSMSKCFDSWKSGGLKGPRSDITDAEPRSVRTPSQGPKGYAATQEKGSGKLPSVYRPIMSRTRKLQLRQKIQNYMFRDAGSWTTMMGCAEQYTLGPIGGKRDISTQTLDDVSSTCLDKMVPSSASGQQNVVPYSANLVCLEACVQVGMASGENHSTLEDQKNIICEQYDLDSDFYRMNHSPIQHDKVWVNHDSQKATNQCMVNDRQTVDAKSAGGDEQRPEINTYLYRMNHSLLQHDPVCVIQDLQKPTNQCMVTNRQTVDAKSTGGGGQRLETNTDLYSISPSPMQHDPVWVNQDSQKATNQCMVTERETMYEKSAEGDRQRLENSIQPPDMLPELNPYKGQSKGILKSSGFHFVPRNNASVDLDFNYYEPIWSKAPPNRLPSSLGSVGIINEENALNRIEPKNSSFLSLNPGHVTSMCATFTSQVFNPLAEKSKIVDRSRLSKLGRQDCRRLSPKKIKALDLSNRKPRKEERRAVSPDCLCCRDNAKYVCKCCLSIRSELRPKTRRVTPDVPIRSEPKPIDCTDVERVDKRKSSLKAPMEAAHYVYKKLKEMIRYY